MNAATLRRKFRLSLAALALFFSFSSQAQNNALDFDGGNDHVSIPHDNQLNLTANDFTIEAWIYANNTTIGTIISKGNGNGLGNEDIIVFQVANGSLRLFVGTTLNSEVSGGGTISTDTWTHVAFTFDQSSQTVEFFVNGISVGTGFVASPVYTGDTNPMYIGRSGTTCNCDYFDGQIDEIRIWNDIRTESELRINATKSLMGSEANLIAYYNFDEGTASADNTGISAPEIQDQTANNFDGTLSGFAKTGSSSNWVDGSGNNVGETFITTWQTTTASETIQIPTNSGSYNYTINWGDGTEESLTSTNPSHVYTDAGTYAISIRGTFGQIYLNNNATYRDKLLTIEQWGSIAWANLNNAFYGCSNMTYNALDAPDLSSVTSISNIFNGCASFNGNVNSWDVSNVQNMSFAFFNADAYNQPLNNWDVSNVTTINHMFSNSLIFNQDISAWDMSSVTNMSAMFLLCPAFDNGGAALTWTAGTGTANAQNMQAIFQGTSFNQDISTWNVGNVTNMSQMFQSNTAFNQNITGWNVSKVTTMASMFSGATDFDQNISGWNTAEVTAMNNMFQNASTFNRDISGWDVSKVTTMSNMFNGASAFNNGGNALTWSTGTSTGEVLSMVAMFLNATAFNQDVSTWDVSKVTSFFVAFSGATSFDQNLASWDISAATNMNSMLNSTALSQTNYDNTLIGWATLGAGESQIPTGITLGASGLTYCAAKAERTSLDDTYTWTFSGDAIASGCVEINLQGNSTDVTDGDTTPSSVDGTDFGFVTTNLGQDFTIQSTGTGSVTVSSIDVSGTNSSEFVISGITTPTSIASSSNTTFTVTFTPAGSGIRTATITVNSDDADESAYDFVVQGSGPAPGGVSSDLQLWLKAGEGFAASQWDDQSGNSNHATQGTGSAQPASTANAINFNTAIDFDGSDFLTLTNDAGTMGLNNSDYELLFIANTSQTDVRFFMSAVTQERYEMHLNGDAGHRFIPANNTDFSDLGVSGDFADGIARIFGGTLQSSGASAASHVNGLFTTDIETAGLQTAETGAITIGRRESNDSFHWLGQMGEVIIYGDAMTATQRQQVFSYLALKYGITLDQTSASDYLAADGGTVWNATTNAVYNDDIAGLARDDASELDQRQSGSINSGAIVEIANGTHASPSAYSADDSWLIWGHDGGASTFGTDNINNNNATTSNRMTRVWRVQETGTVGSVQIRFSNSLATGTVSIVAHTSDSSFPADGNRRVVEMTDDGTHYLGEIDLADGEYFSFVNANYATLTSQFVVINEVITDPQQDWGASNFFDPSPGGTGNSDDEWIELYIATDNLDLTNWTIEMNDGTDVSGNLAAGGAFNQSNYRSLTGGFLNNTKAGDYLILGDPSSGMMNSVGGLTVILKDGSGGTIDQVTIATGSGTGFSGSASSTTDESVARIPNGSDTDVDATDFVKTRATLGESSTPSGTVVINEVVTDPFTDWSSGGFDGSDGGSTVSNIDEWVELYIGTDGLNLTGWTISLIDGSGDVVDQSIAAGGAFSVNQYFGSGSFINTAAGDYLVLGNPGSGTSAMRNDVQITLKDASGNTIDQVQLGGGSGEAPSGANSAFNSEAIVRYPNATDTGTDNVDFIQTRPTLGTTNSPTGTVVINEIVTDPKQDWSTNGFDGTIGGTTIDADDEDEWVELYIASSEINLTGWTISLEDGSGDIVDQSLAAGGAFTTSNYIVNSMIGSFENTEAGDFLVLGNPTGSGTVEMDNDVQITLKDASGNTVDQVKLGGGSSEAPSGASTGISDEAIARIPNGTDTDNNASDFTAGPATLGAVNQTAQLPGIGNGLVFDGVDDFVEIGTITNLNDADFTIEFWVNTTVNTASILTLSDGDATYEAGEKHVYIHPDGWVGFTAFGNGFITSTGLGFIDDGNWHHVAVVWDYLSGTSGNGSIYVDGVDVTAGSTIATNNADFGTIKLGQKSNHAGTATNDFAGTLDEVRFWNVVRTHEEIIENMMGLLDPSESNLQAYYRFDQSSGTTVPDLTSSNNGTLTNMAGTEWTAAGWDIFAQNQAIFQTGGSDTSTGTSGELTLTDVSFLNDDNDLLLAGHDNGSFTEDFADLPSSTLVTARYGRIWNLTKNDASGTSNGSVRLGFGLGATPDVTYTYYLLERTGTSGDFAIVPVLGVNPNGNSIEFTVDASAIDNGSYYTLGRSDAGVGNALDFDGTDDYVEITDDTSIDFDVSENFTVETWVKIPSTAQVDNSGTRNDFISKWNGAGATPYAYNIRYRNDDNRILAARYDGSNAPNVTSVSTFNDDQWHHVAFVKNGSSLLLYVDGLLEVTSTDNTSSTTLSSSPLTLGARFTTNQRFTGELDEVRIWSDTRTQQEILDNMFANLTGDEANLAAYYRFNQGIGDSNTSLPDLSPNGNAGTLTNFDNLGSATTSSNYVSSTRSVINTSAIISNGGSLTATDGELTLTSTQTAGDFLQDANDFIRWNNDGGDFTETTDDIPTGTLITNRYTKTWQLDKNDAVGTANGNVTFTFDLGSVPDPDYTYFVLSRSGTSGGFSIVEALSSSPSGNTISFTVDAGEITDDNYFTLGRTDAGAGNSLDFDGTNDGVNLGGQLINASSLTIEAWVNGSSFTNSGRFNRIVALNYDTYTSDNPFTLFVDASGQIGYVFGTGDATNDAQVPLSFSPTLSINTWYHVALTFDGSTKSLYIDGILQGTVSNAGTFTNTNSEPLLIGDFDIATSDNGEWEGQIDEVRIWSDVRTEQELRDNMNRKLDVADESNLLGYYQFNTGIAGSTNTGVDVLTDRSGNGNSGTLSNFALSGTSSNWVSSGATIADQNLSNSLQGAGNALDFDGVEERVTIPDDNTLDLSTTLTLEAWINTTSTNEQYILAKGNNYYLSMNVSTGKVGIFISSVTSVPLESTTNVNDGNWHHIAATFNSAASELRIFVDGIEENFIALGDMPFDSSVPLEIGSRNNTNFFSGQIDEVRIWNTTRSASEIQSNMFESLTGGESGLVAYYTFNESSGSTLDDESANANTGTLQNMEDADWVDASAREPFKTNGPGNLNSGGTWVGGATPGASQTLYVQHDLTVDADLTVDDFNLTSGNTLTLGAGQTLTITGNLVNNGTITGDGKIQFTSGNPMISGGTFSNLEMNGGSPVLCGNTTLTGTLTMTSGNLQLEGFNLTLNSGASITGGSSSSYIQTLNQNSSGGSVSMEIGSSNGVVTYPIGTSTNYTPIFFTNLGTTATFAIRTFDGIYTENTSGTAITSEVINKTWDVNATGSGFNVTLSIQWNTADETAGFDRTNMFVSTNDGSGWVQRSGQVSATEISSGIYQATASGITGFSGVGGGGDVITPVTLLDFYALEMEEAIELVWHTATEINNEKFIIERSADGIEFTAIDEITGNGDSDDIIEYRYVDTEPLVGSNYYRLKQMDFDGEFEYSPIVLAETERITHDLVVYPNPFSDRLYIGLKEAAVPANVKLTSMNGQVILSESVISDNRFVQFEDLQASPGIYILEIEQSGEIVRLRIVNE